MLFLSTFEATNLDGSTRNPTKSIVDPYVVNTAVSRARSLVVSVGNPYLLLSMEKHMCKKYGEKAKKHAWSMTVLFLKSMWTRKKKLTSCKN